MGAAGEVRASYNHYRLSADVTGFSVPTLKANQLSLGYVHNLSKRTALYGTYAYLKNKNDSGVNMGLELNGAMRWRWSVQQRCPARPASWHSPRFLI